MHVEPCDSRCSAFAGGSEDYKSTSLECTYVCALFRVCICIGFISGNMRTVFVESVAGSGKSVLVEQ